MSLLCDKEIIELCVHQEMIVPYTIKNIRENADGQKVISYGLSTIGYDVSLSAEKAVIFNNGSHTLQGIEIDPLNFDDNALIDLPINVCEKTGHKYYLLPPHGFMLGFTNEKFTMPDDVGAVCFGKSSIARCGLIVNVTPIEPGFIGTIVIEISNTTPLPVRVYADQGISQFTFHRTNQRPMVTYGDKSGKYQNQHGVVTSKG